MRNSWFFPVGARIRQGRRASRRATHPTCLMSDGPDNIVLRFLWTLDTKFDRMSEDIREIKVRVGALEGQYASISRRMDSLDFRVERIERRIGLIGEDAGQGQARA